MSAATRTPPGSEDSPLAVARLLRERDRLFLLHEALADVERARTLPERLRILVEAIQLIGFGRVETVEGYVMPGDANVVAWLSNSAFLNTEELIVPLRTVDGRALATLVLGEPSEAGSPSLELVRTVELFA